MHKSISFISQPSISQGRKHIKSKKQIKLTENLSTNSSIIMYTSTTIPMFLLTILSAPILLGIYTLLLIGQTIFYMPADKSY